MPGGDLDDLADGDLDTAVVAAQTAHGEITPDSVAVGVDELFDHPVGVD
ncbi:MAG: hypothetical protein KDB72_14325 [Mycobacterium sp.]|nr:hypothetical protein [Mycobacterium sp.]